PSRCERLILLTRAPTPVELAILTATMVAFVNLLSKMEQALLSRFSRAKASGGYGRRHCGPECPSPAMESSEDAQIDRLRHRRRGPRHHHRAQRRARRSARPPR